MEELAGVVVAPHTHSGDNQGDSPVAAVVPAGGLVAPVEDTSANRWGRKPRPGRIANHNSPVALVVLAAVAAMVEMVFVRYFPCSLYMIYL